MFSIGTRANRSRKVVRRSSGPRPFMHRCRLLGVSIFSIRQRVTGLHDSHSPEVVAKSAGWRCFQRSWQLSGSESVSLARITRFAGCRRSSSKSGRLDEFYMGIVTDTTLPREGLLRDLIWLLHRRHVKLGHFVSDCTYPAGPVGFIPLSR